jgi:hypothetical protein
MQMRAVGQAMLVGHPVAPNGLASAASGLGIAPALPKRDDRVLERCEHCSPARLRGAPALRNDRLFASFCFLMQ